MCPECLEVGSSVVRENLKIKAKDLRKWAESLDRLASQKIELPAFDEYKEKLKEGEKEYVKELGIEYEMECELQPFTEEGLPF